jgi:hypothetical protein
MISLAVNLLFWLSIACSLAAAFVFGRRTERVFVLVLVAASIATLLANRAIPEPVGKMEVVRLIDLALFAIAWVLALKSDRFWPIWFTAMQTLSVLTEPASWQAEGIPHLIFSNLAAFWSLPGLIVLAGGTILDWRKRASASPKSRRHDDPPYLKL